MLEDIGGCIEVNIWMCYFGNNKVWEIVVFIE